MASGSLDLVYKYFKINRNTVELYKGQRLRDSTQEKDRSIKGEAKIGSLTGSESGWISTCRNQVVKLLWSLWSTQAPESTRKKGLGLALQQGDF